MTSDAERREVARKLRELDYSDLQESLICAYLDALGIEGYTDWVGIAHRLADLIESESERTCRDVGDGDKFVCSKCGASFYYEGRWDEPTYWVDDVAAAAVEYCPNCGARVVDE